MASSNFIRLLDAVPCPMLTGNWENDGADGAAYDRYLVESYQTEFVLVGKCISDDETIRLKYKFEHSPDGVSWTPLKNSDGKEINFECTSVTSSDPAQTCYIQVIDTPVLPYIRGICGEGDSNTVPTPETACTLDLYYSTFK